MGKIAFVFPGQGAQYTGMGKDIFENNIVAKETFSKIDEIRPNTSKECFEAEISELSVTKNTQPCIFAVEMAIANSLLDAGIKPDCLAGFSLGEVTALTFANAFNFNDGVNFICKRAAYMQLDSEKVETGMVAVLKLENSKVEEIADKFLKVFPVNYNCPGQLVVAGDKEELVEFSSAIKEVGGAVVPLKVSGGFHSPFMEEASNKIFSELNNVKFNELKYPVYSDYTSNLYDENIAELLSNQVKKPVLWEKIVKNMLLDGVDTFIEVGPGKVLSGLIKKMTSDANIYNVEDSVSLNNVVSELKGVN